MFTKNNIRNINLKKVSNNNGELIFIESRKIFKTGFKRFFTVSVKKQTTRGNHSHYKTTQILFSLHGNIIVLAYKKKNKSWTKFKLKKNMNYLIVPPNNFLKIKYSSSNSILGVLCDRYYESEDYNYNKD